MRKVLLGLAASTALVAVAGGANAAVFTVDYYKVAADGQDFGPCCGPPSSTTVNISTNAILGPNGRPVAEGGSTAIEKSAGGELQWWTAANYTGSGILPVPLSTNMFAPNNTGTNNANGFETAILSSNFIGSGAAATLTISSDDDAFVYLDGLYIGGNPGVHSTQTVNLGVPALTGLHNIKIFYADRAQVAANLAVSAVGINLLGSGTPEPATWGLMLVGFGGLGAMMRRRRSAALTA